MIYIIFCLGLLIGTIAGVVVACLCAAAKAGDPGLRDLEGINKNLDKQIQPK